MLRLGGPIFKECDSYEEMAQAHRELGYRAAYCPVHELDADKIADARKAFEAADVQIADTCGEELGEAEAGSVQDEDGGAVANGTMSAVVAATVMDRSSVITSGAVIAMPRTPTTARATMAASARAAFFMGSSSSQVRGPGT